MQIHGLNKTTLLDYPGRLAATVFTGLCSFRCPFCHNGDLVICPETQPLIPEEEVLAHLKKRKGILNGLCVSGGEPTLQPDLPEFLKKVKELDYPVKLDTNGYQPEFLEQLIADGLVDQIAMDIKSGRENYALVSGLSTLDFSRIEHSIRIIMECGLPYEFRTTVVKELHRDTDFLQIRDMIGGCMDYFLQSYVDSGQVLHPGFHACSVEEMKHFLSLVLPGIPNAQIRGEI